MIADYALPAQYQIIVQTLYDQDFSTSNLVYFSDVVEAIDKYLEEKVD